jgi:hypothetical protein
VAGLHGLGRSGRIGTGPNGSGLARVFFEIFLPASVLNPSVLTGYGFDGLDHGSGQVGSRPRVQLVRSDPSRFFYNSLSGCNLN